MDKVSNILGNPVLLDFCRKLCLTGYLESPVWLVHRAEQIDEVDEHLDKKIG